MKRLCSQKNKVFGRIEGYYYTVPVTVPTVPVIVGTEVSVVGKAIVAGVKYALWPTEILYYVLEKSKFCVLTGWFLYVNGEPSVKNQSSSLFIRLSQFILVSCEPEYSCWNQFCMTCPTGPWYFSGMNNSPVIWSGSFAHFL